MGRTPHGERHYAAKVTDAIVAEIRRLAATNALSHDEIADRFGIARGTMTKIAGGGRWKHLPFTPRTWPTKLDRTAVIEIRRLAAALMPQRQIAARFGVCQRTVAQVIHRRTWAHVI